MTQKDYLNHGKKITNYGKSPVVHNWFPENTILHAEFKRYEQKFKYSNKYFISIQINKITLQKTRQIFFF